MRALGWAILLLFVLDWFQILDFRVCLKPVGQCEAMK